MAGTQRYWDGETWSSHVAPQQSGPAYVVPMQERANSTLEAIGFICAVIFPIGGFVIGVTQINKAGNNGVYMILLSLLCAAAWYYFILNG